MMIQQALELAIQHHQAGRLHQAELLYRQILAQQPGHADALHMLGVIAHQMGHHDGAVDLIRQAIARQPNFPGALSNLGLALKDLGKFDEAIAAFRQAIGLRPNFGETYSNLGLALQAKGEIDAAIAAFRQAIFLKPGYAEAHYNLGIALKDKGQVDAAIAAYHLALALKPYSPAAYSNLGTALKDQGQVGAAIAAYRQALILTPEDARIHSNLVYALCFQPTCDALALAEEQRRWNHQHADPLKVEIQPHTNERAPERRLRIGYVSPDFRDQSESFFTVPLLEHHDHGGFEIYCYSSVIRPDPITARLQKGADVWRDVAGEKDASLAAIIRRDGIDILVDLTMHMAYNRALLFARKPAPVQVCWLAYPGSSGLEMMDYRLTDAFMDPVDADTSCYTEQSIRLPDCWVVYDSLIDLPPRPAEQSGPITFGSLNNPGKLNDPLVLLWARVLQAVPGSRLLLQVLSGEHRQRIERMMESQGITPDRLQFVGKMGRPQYLRCYDQIDIALDPLPYNGITTTCDALWMGVPVLTLAGQTAAGRAGKALLSTIGLGEWVTHTPDEFVQRAVELAADLPGLIELRRSLRARITASPLMDAPRFARHMEAAYRQMWRQWCAPAPALR
jgi:protein O-GlcNAc transferase